VTWARTSPGMHSQKSRTCLFLFPSVRSQFCLPFSLCSILIPSFTLALDCRIDLCCNSELNWSLLFVAASNGWTIGWRPLLIPAPSSLGAPLVPAAASPWGASLYSPDPNAQVSPRPPTSSDDLPPLIFPRFVFCHCSLICDADSISLANRDFSLFPNLLFHKKKHRGQKEISRPGHIWSGSKVGD
jgi:hypothetical protein